MQKPQMRLIEIKGDELNDLIARYEKELSEICGVQMKLIPKMITPKKETFGKDFIIKTVCENYGIELKDLKSKVRKRRLCEPRHALMFFLYKYSNLGLCEIGKLLQKDHATVIHGKRVYQEYYIQSAHLTKAHNLTVEALS